MHNRLKAIALEVLKMYQTSGPDIQIYKAFILLPWGMKPLVGLLSDYMPIFG